MRVKSFLKPFRHCPYWLPYHLRQYHCWPREDFNFSLWGVWNLDTWRHTPVVPQGCSFQHLLRTSKSLLVGIWRKMKTPQSDEGSFTDYGRAQRSRPWTILLRVYFNTWVSQSSTFAPKCHTLLHFVPLRDGGECNMSEDIQGWEHVFLNRSKKLSHWRGTANYCV